jgi:hypothetical protein
MEAGENERLRFALDSFGATIAEQPYEAKRKAIGQVQDVFRRWAGEFLKPALMKRIESMPQNSIEDRRKLTHWLSDELRPLGLVVQCPKTGRPSLMYYHGERIGLGAFRFETVDEKNRRVDSFRSQLPNLNFIPDTEQRSHLARYKRKQNDANSQRG